MSNDTIYRQDAVDAINELHDKPNAWLDLAVEALEKLPSTQPERKKGKWIANGDIPKECPFCDEDWDKYVFGDIWYTGELPKFCPNCGADMRGEQDD